MNLSKFLFFKLLILIAFLFSSLEIKAKDDIIPINRGGTSGIVVIHDPSIPRPEKEALIVISGIDGGKKGRKKIHRYFKNYEYDLFIPNYINRKSFDKSVDNFTQFFQLQKLGEYRKVHVFAYILGTWTLNSFIIKNGKQNIATIVYDRSPLQERAPKVAHAKMPFVTKVLAGKLIRQLAKIEYPTIDKSDIKIGIIVESKATPLIRFFKKKTMSYGPIDWHNLELNQDHDDLFFTRLHHAEMYSNFDLIGNDILFFIKNGTFTKEAKRIPFDWDVFKKYKK